jgi:hypothetical protein
VINQNTTSPSFLCDLSLVVSVFENQRPRELFGLSYSTYLKTKGHWEYLFQVIVFGNEGCENYLVKSVKQWEECMVV